MPTFPTYEAASAYMRGQVERGYKCQLHFALDGVTVTCVYDMTAGFESPARPVLPKEHTTLASYAAPPVQERVRPIKQETIIPGENVILNLPVELRDYQKQAVQFVLSHPHSIIELPTGKGKSIVALAIANEIIRDNPGKTVLVVVPTTDLVQQWVNDGFAAAGVEASSVYSEEKNWSQFTVITYQSAIRNIARVAAFDIVVFDEVHHLFAPTYRELLIALLQQPHHKYIIGLTATIRHQGPEAREQERYFDIMSIPLSQFQQNAETRIPVEIKITSVRLSTAELDLYNRLQATVSRANRELGPLPNWPRYLKTGGSEAKLAGAALTANAEQNKLLAIMPEKIDKVVEIIRNNPGQFIVFSDSIEQIQNYEDALQRAGISEGSIYSGVPQAKRNAVIAGIRDKSIRVLVGGNAITEGLDIPDVSNAIFTSFLVKEPRSYIQRIGRILRPVPGKVARIWLIYTEDTKEANNVRIIEHALGEAATTYQGGL